MKKFNDIDIDLFLSMMRVSDIFGRELADGLLKYKLSKPQFDILYCISRSAEEKETLSSLVRKNNFSKSNVSSILTRLEQKGLVKREQDQYDKRVVWLVTTEKGEALVNEFVVAPRGRIKELLSSFPSMQKESCYQMTETVRSQLIR